MRSVLWKETRDLHHACEEHDVGSAMASGKPPLQWYADWVKSLFEIHSVIDIHYPNSINRIDKLQLDLNNLVKPNDLIIAKEYAEKLKTEKQIAGTAYVLTGAHLMGGAVMKKRLIDYPTNHLDWEDRKQALRELNKLRSREDVIQESKDCFATLLEIMDEIKGK